MTTPGRPGGSPTAPADAGPTAPTEPVRSPGPTGPTEPARPAGATRPAEPVNPAGRTVPTRPADGTGPGASPAQSPSPTGAASPPVAAGSSASSPAPRLAAPPETAEPPTQTYPPVQKEPESAYQGVERRRAFQTTPGATAAAPPVRRARLRLARIDPWSVMKMSFLLSIALGIVAFIAVFVLWSVLDSMRVFESLSTQVATITETDDSAGFDLMQYVALDRVLGVTTIVMLVNVVLLTALATLAAFIYNLAAALVGGLDITWTDPD